jgi:hypothetical protein
MSASFYPVTKNGVVVSEHNNALSYYASSKVGLLVSESDDGKTINLPPGQVHNVLYFTATPNIAEIGQSVPSVLLEWEYDRPVNNQSIDLGAIPLLQGQRSVTVTGPFTSNQTWTLTSNAGVGNVAAIAQLLFQSRRMWGLSTDTTPNQGTLDSLSEQGLDIDRTDDVQFNNCGGQYLYFAWPASFGDPTFYVNGFKSTAWIKTVLNFTNAYSYVQSYYAFRSLYKQYGTGIDIVVT